MASFRARSRSAAGSTRGKRRPGSPLPPAQQRPLFSAIEDFNRGAVATNDQLKSWLGYVQRSFAVDQSQLSQAGRSLVHDITELVSLLQRVVDEKNGDQLLQRFFTHARLASKLAVQGMGRSGKIAIVKEPRRQVFLFGSRDWEVKENAARMRREAVKEVRALYRLLQFIVASPDVRTAVSQMQTVATKMFHGQRAPRAHTRPGSGAAERHVSFEQHQSKYEQPAYEQQRYRSSIEPEQLDSRIASLRREVQSTGEDIGSIRTGHLGYQPLSGPSGDFLEVREETTASGEYIFKSQAPEGFGQFAAQQPGSEPFKPITEQAGYGQQPGMSGIRRLEPSELVEISPEQTEKLPIMAHGQPPREEFHEEYLPQKPLYEQPFEEPTKEPLPEAPRQAAPSDADKRDIILSLRELLRTLAKNRELQTTLQDALQYTSALQAVGVEAVQSPAGPIASELQYEENIKAAQRDLLGLLERFAGGASLTPLFGIVQRLKARTQTDYELKDFFGDWRSFFKRCLAEAEYMASAEYEHRAGFLIDRTRDMHAKYGAEFEEGMGVASAFLAGWKQDRLTAQIGAVLQRIVKQDLAAGGSQPETANGLFMFSILKPDLMHDFRHVLLPSMLSNLHEIPLPRIEALSDGNRLVLENIVIPAGGFMPVDLDVRQTASMRMNPRDRLLGRFGGSRVEKTARARSGWHNAVKIRMYAWRRPSPANPSVGAG